MKYDDKNPMIGVANKVRETFVDAPGCTTKEYAHAIKEVVRWARGIEEAVMEMDDVDKLNWTWIQQSLMALYEVSARANYKAQTVLNPTIKMPSLEEQLQEAVKYAKNEFKKLKKTKLAAV